MTYVFYPGLNLFLYSRRNGLGDTEANIQNNFKTFWQNLPLELHASATEAFLSESKATDITYHELLSSSVAWFEKITARDEPIEGYHYPIRLGDSYALLVNVFLKDVKYHHPVDCFQRLAQITDKYQGNLGKTWMLSFCLDAQNGDKIETYAELAYQALTGNKPPKLKSGKFLGATIFEVLESPLSPKTDDKDHVLILIYPNPKVEENAAKYYEDWLQLWCDRNKILWAYKKTRELKKQLQHSFASLYQQQDNLHSLSLLELRAKLETNLATLSEYASALNYLEVYLQTIQVNLQNYQQQLDSLIEAASQEGETHLPFAAHFVQIVKQQYLPQIRSDHASLSPGLRILEDVIDTIRGIVAVKQTESDRRLEQAVAAAGFGIGAASAAASSISPYIEGITGQPYASPDTEELSFQAAVLNVSVAFILSILAGALVGSIAWYVVKRMIHKD